MLEKEEKGGSTVWRINRESQYKHPTQKPIELISKAVQNSSRRNDIVVDQFSGSGATMVTCHQMGRNARCMDLEPKWVQVTLDRMKELDAGIGISKRK